MRLSTTAIAPSLSSSGVLPAPTRATASIGVTATPVSLGLLPSCDFVRQSWMARSSFQDAEGISDFEALASAIRGEPERLLFYAFDLLHLDGRDLRDSTLLKRRAQLKELLPPDETRPLQFSEEFTGDAAAFFQACADRQLEGVVSKFASSKYRSGRSKTWLKTKCFTESAFVIIGTARDRKTGAPLALLAQANRHGLAYVGSAFIALSGNEREELWRHLESLKVVRCPLARFRLPGAEWVTPKLMAQVRHLAGSKYLRHGTVRGVRANWPGAWR
jgi:bifunctional non-homologous end joining protein LigD